MSQDFLSRWSRRKLEAEAEEQLREKPVESPSQDDAAREPESAPEADEISPEELAALPAVEELTAASDFAAFLRKGVPLVLRNAALRRMWVLDPAIRDFVGDARDYAWDWNIPGGVPVSGPLAEGTDVQAMVRRIMGEEREDRAPQSARENVMAERDAEPLEPQPTAQSEPKTSQPIESVEIEETAASEEPEQADLPPAKKHGGALPV